MTGDEIEVTADLSQNPWLDMEDYVPIGTATITRIGLLPDGTEQGEPAVLILTTDVETGCPTVAYTTWKLLRAAVDALVHTLPNAVPKVEREWGASSKGYEFGPYSESVARMVVSQCWHRPPCVLVSRTSPDAAWEATS